MCDKYFSIIQSPKVSCVTNYGGFRVGYIIEFTYYDHWYSSIIALEKMDNYQSLIDDLETQGWNAKPLIVIIARAPSTIHIPSLESLDKDLNLPMTRVSKTLVNINTVSIY